MVNLTTGATSGGKDNPAILTAAPFRECHNRKRTVEDTGDTQQREKDFAVRFRVVCLLLTTSGEVVLSFPNDKKSV